MMEPKKKNFIHLLQLLSSEEMQDRYQSEVDVDIYDELICMWFDDFYSQEARGHIMSLLSSLEKKHVDEFHQFFLYVQPKLPTNYKDLCESEDWVRVREKADETLKSLNWDKVETK